MVEDRQTENWIGDLVGNLTDPIIVWPSPWMADLPEDVKNRVPIERMVLQMRYHAGDIKEMTATDAEALLYMFPRSLEDPMGHDWSEIYIYLGAQVCGRMGREVPEELKNTLTSYQMQHLERLKRWIYEARVKHRKEKERVVRRAEKEEKQKQAPEVVQHAFQLDS